MLRFLNTSFHLFRLFTNTSHVTRETSWIWALCFKHIMQNNMLISKVEAEGIVHDNPIKAKSVYRSFCSNKTVIDLDWALGSFTNLCRSTGHPFCSHKLEGFNGRITNRWITQSFNQTGWNNKLIHLIHRQKTVYSEKQHNKLAIPPNTRPRPATVLSDLSDICDLAPLADGF